MRSCGCLTRDHNLSTNNHFVVSSNIITSVTMNTSSKNLFLTIKKYRNVQKSVVWPLDDGILCLPSGYLYGLIQTLEHQREEKICINVRVRQWARRLGGASGWSRGRSAVYAPVTAAHWITNAEIIKNPSISHDRV